MRYGSRYRLESLEGLPNDMSPLRLGVAARTIRGAKEPIVAEVRVASPYGLIHGVNRMQPSRHKGEAAVAELAVEFSNVGAGH